MRQTCPNCETLKKKNIRQLAELRRLNKLMVYYWRGFHRTMHFELLKEFRLKMFAAFGSDAALKAEHARCTCVGNKANDGWWCPLHGYQRHAERDAGK